MIERRALLVAATRLIALLPLVSVGANPLGDAGLSTTKKVAPGPLAGNRAWLCVGHAALAATATSQRQ